MLTVNCIEKKKIKKKRPGMAHFKKKKKPIPAPFTGWTFFTLIVENTCNVCFTDRK